MYNSYSQSYSSNPYYQQSNGYYQNYPQSYQQNFQQQNYQQQNYQQQSYYQGYQQSTYPGYSSQSYGYSPCNTCQTNYQAPQVPAPLTHSLSSVTPPKSSPRPTKLREIKALKPVESPCPFATEKEPISAFKSVVQAAPEPIIVQTVAPCAQPSAPCYQPTSTPIPEPVEVKVAPAPVPCASSGDCTPEGTLPQPPPYVSKIEQQIKTSTTPIASNEIDIIEINGVRGLWLNKAEVESWRGEIPISEYAINSDSNPEVIRLRNPNCVDRVQDLAIKYLKPPRPPTPGPIVIKQEANIPTAPAPPIIIRQLAPEPCNPSPAVVRERPPPPPEPICARTIVIPGQRLPPPPRRVIIEKLAPVPPNLQSVTVERWLPYDKRERRVVLEKKPCDPCVEKPKNVIYEWEPQCVNQKTEVKDLGIESADPVQYVQTHGESLKVASELPKFVLDLNAPQSLEANNEISLVGDVHGLRLLDLNKEGLSEYKKYVN